MERVKAKLARLTQAFEEARKKIHNNEVARAKRVNYRARVQYVAYSQLFVATCSIFIFTAAFVYGLSATIVLVHLSKDLACAVELAFILFWATMTLLAFNIFLNLKASLRLLTATELGVTAEKALDCIRYWKHITYVLTILEFLVMAGPLKMVYMTVVWALIRMIFLKQVGAYQQICEKKVLAAQKYPMMLIKEMANAAAALPLEIVVPPESKAAVKTKEKQ